jgi:two-component system chemotaxis response regulator CheY
MILIIEDDKFAQSVMLDTLANGGYEIVGHANSGREGIDLALEYDPDIITLDYMLPDMSGLEILQVLKAKKLNPKVIMVSALQDTFIMEECRNMGIFDYLIKPVSPVHLKETISRAYASLEDETVKVLENKPVHKG